MTIHFLLPGYAPQPVGGYRVVYEYATWMGRNLDEPIVIHHSPLSVLRYTRPLAVRDIVGLASREIHGVLDRPSTRGVPWFRETSIVRSRFGASPVSSTLSPGDILIATAAQTAIQAASLLGRNPGVLGVHFIQHLEIWSTSKRIVDAAWDAPLKRIVIAPWLQAHGAARGLETVLVPNAIDPSTFPPGPSLEERPRRVVAMVSEAPFKRLDVLVGALQAIRQRDESVDIVTFGVSPRPDSLPDFVEYFRSPTRDQLAELYRSARAYICSSDAEGWHLPPAEALLSGACVVSTDIGGVRAYADGVALFSPPGDAEVLAANALRAVDDAALAQPLVDRGRDRLMSYSPADAAEAFAREVLSVRETVDV